MKQMNIDRQTIPNQNNTSGNRRKAMQDIRKYLINKLGLSPDVSDRYIELYEILIEESAKFPDDRPYTLRSLMPPDLWRDAVGSNASAFGIHTKNVVEAGFLPFEYAYTDKSGHTFYKIIRRIHATS